MEYCAVYVLTLAFLHGPFWVASNNWCKEQCSDEKHLRCLFELKKCNPRCPKIEINFSPEDKMEVLDNHNRWRDYVASGSGHEGPQGYWIFDLNKNETISSKDLPKDCFKDRNCAKDRFVWRDPEGQAADMRQLVWDYELERNAAIWASQCDPSTFVPYHCAFTENFSVVHMNVDSSNLVGTFPLEAGFGAFLNFIIYSDNFYKGDRVKLVRSYHPGMWDTFYAMIYSQTYAIGCTRVFCDCHRDELPHGLRQCGTIACLYGPSFDKTSASYKIYEVGKEPCSRCPKGTACRADARYKYLCARPDDPKFPKPIPDKSDQCKHLPTPTNLCFTLIVLLATL